AWRRGQGRPGPWRGDLRGWWQARTWPRYRSGDDRPPASPPPLADDRRADGRRFMGCAGADAAGERRGVPPLWSAFGGPGRAVRAGATGGAPAALAAAAGGDAARRDPMARGRGPWACRRATAAGQAP